MLILSGVYGIAAVCRRKDDSDDRKDERRMRRMHLRRFYLPSRMVVYQPPWQVDATINLEEIEYHGKANVMKVRVEGCFRFGKAQRRSLQGRDGRTRHPRTRRARAGGA